MNYSVLIFIAAVILIVFTISILYIKFLVKEKNKKISKITDLMYQTGYTEQEISDRQEYLQNQSNEMLDSIIIEFKKAIEKEDLNEFLKPLKRL